MKHAKLFGRLTAVICTAVIAVSAVMLEPEQPTAETAALSASPKLAAAVSANADTDAAAEKTEDNSSDEREHRDTENDAPRLSAPPDDSSESASDGAEKHDNNSRAADRRASDESGSDNSGSTSSHGENSSGRSDSGSDGGSVQSDSVGNDNAPGKAPEKGSTSDRELFETDIIDGGHYSESRLDYTVTHLDSSLTVRQISAVLNGDTQIQAGTLMLAEGEDRIEIYVSYTDAEGRVVSGFREYTVYLDTQAESGEPQLYCDLYDHTRTDPALSFSAYMTGAAENVEIKAYCGLNRIYPDGESYSCTLEMGTNSIRLSVSYDSDGERFTIERQYSIKLVAETTPETAPYLEYHNVPQQVRGDVYNLDIVARSCDGERIYPDGIYMTLNGGVQECRWGGEYSTYLLYLAAGENTLEIRLTDALGRTADYSFVIGCTHYQNGEVLGRCTLKVDAAVLGLGDLDECSFDIRQGESASREIISALESMGCVVIYSGDIDSGCFISRIVRSGIATGAAIPDDLMSRLENDGSISINGNSSSDSLGNYDFTSGSGWMISVNGHFTSYGSSDMHLKDGDELRLRFTLAVGKDIGDTGGEGGYDIVY